MKQQLKFNIYNRVQFCYYKYDIILMLPLFLNKILKPLTAYSDVLRAIVFKMIGLAHTKFEFDTPALY